MDLIKRSDAIKEREMDLIKRSDAIKAIDDLPHCYNGWSDAYDKAYIILTLEEVPKADRQIIYGNEHNCIMTIFGECSYNETGCGSCAVVEKVRKALSADSPQGEWIYYTTVRGITDMYKCSECGNLSEGRSKFCKHCGCDMRKGADDE